MLSDLQIEIVFPLAMALTSKSIISDLTLLAWDACRNPAIFLSADWC